MSLFLNENFPSPFAIDVDKEISRYIQITEELKGNDYNNNITLNRCLKLLESNEVVLNEGFLTTAITFLKSIFTKLFSFLLKVLSTVNIKFLILAGIFTAIVALIAASSGGGGGGSGGSSKGSSGSSSTKSENNTNGENSKPKSSSSTGPSFGAAHKKEAPYRLPITNVTAASLLNNDEPTNNTPITRTKLQNDLLISLPMGFPTGISVISKIIQDISLVLYNLDNYSSSLNKNLFDVSNATRDNYLRNVNIIINTKPDDIMELFYSPMVGDTISRTIESANKAINFTQTILDEIKDLELDTQQEMTRYAYPLTSKLESEFFTLNQVINARMSSIKRSSSQFKDSEQKLLSDLNVLDYPKTDNYTREQNEYFKRINQQLSRDVQEITSVVQLIGKFYNNTDKIIEVYIPVFKSVRITSSDNTIGKLNVYRIVK